MKGSGIGGQAVMEGVMMKNGDKYAVAVRKPDNEIIVDVKEHKSLGSSIGLNKVPILRGVIAFIDSLTLGVGTLTYSASFFEEDENAPKDEASVKKQQKQEKAMMAATVVVSVILAVGIFMLLPYFLSQLLKSLISSAPLLALVEGIIRVLLFVGYVAAISMMSDIKRVYMYHGAEHKSINCIEHGLELNVENVRKQTRFHKRCGTSFLLIVMLISVVFFMFIRVDNAWLRIVVRLLLIPVIAGISYEFIRLAGKSDNKVVGLLSKPGMALQRLTTREPDDSMIECAIASVEAVFDWKKFLEDYDKPSTAKGCCDYSVCAPTSVADAKEENAAEASKETETAAAGSSKDKKANAKSSRKKLAKENKPSKKADAEVKTEVKTDAETEVKTEAKTDAETEAKTEAKTDAETEVKAEAKAEAKTEVKTRNDFKRPTLVDDDEDDEILQKLDQYFVLSQKKDEK